MKRLRDLHCRISKPVTKLTCRGTDIRYTHVELNWKNRTKRPKITPYVYGPLLCDKVAKRVQWEKKRIFSTNGSGTRYQHAKE